MSTDDILTGLMHVLTDEDDVRLWRALLAVLVIDVDAVVASDPSEDDVLVELGSCSRWLRPHQTRWTAAGSFAWPVGYGDAKGFGLPALDRSQTFRRDPAKGAWAWAKGRLGRRPLVLRVAVPTRTTRHAQAAVHTIWTPGSPAQPDVKRERFLGFRSVDDDWKLVADSRPLWR